MLKKKKKKEGREDKIRNILELGLKVEEGKVKDGEKEDVQKMENIKKKEKGDGRKKAEERDKRKKRRKKVEVFVDSLSTVALFYFISEIEFNLK